MIEDEERVRSLSSNQWKIYFYANRFEILVVYFTFYVFSKVLGQL